MQLARWWTWGSAVPSQTKTNKSSNNWTVVAFIQSNVPMQKMIKTRQNFFIMIKGSFYQYEEAFAVFSSVFRGVVDRNAPLKQKMVHGNNAPFSAWNESFFTWPAIFMEKQKSLLIKTRDSKISYGCGGHCNLCMLSSLYFLIWIIQSCPFLMSLMNLFSYMLSRFYQNLSHHLIIEQIPALSEF